MTTDYFDDDETCWNCHGEGGWHECGEDTCCCIDPEEITEYCPECDGTGRIVVKRGDEDQEEPEA